MAEDYRGIDTFPYIKQFTLGASNICTEIKLPKQASRIQIGAESHKSNVATSGTDNTTISTDNMFIPQGNIITIKLGRGSTRQNSLFVASQSGSTVISLILEEE